MNNPSHVQDTRCAATSSEGEGCRLRTRPRPRLCRGGRGPSSGVPGEGLGPQGSAGQGVGTLPIRMGCPNGRDPSDCLNRDSSELQGRRTHGGQRGGGKGPVGARGPEVSSPRVSSE